MSSDLKVLQVIPKLGYGGAETGCFDIAHYLPENNCKSFIVTSGGELLKFVDRKKVKVFRPRKTFLNFFWYHFFHNHLFLKSKKVFPCKVLSDLKMI